MLPKRRTKLRRANPDRINRAHRAWVRGHMCAVPGCEVRSMEFAHVRLGGAGSLRGGVGIKPSDDAGIPLCAEHHAESHRIGQRTFDAKHKIDSAEIARKLAAASPHLKKPGEKT